MKEYPTCQAPIHQDSCNGRGETIDHLTPRCIAALLHWTHKQINSADNLQYLSIACHRQKDATTPAKLYQLKAQLAGGTVGFGGHI